MSYWPEANGNGAGEMTFGEGVILGVILTVLLITLFLVTGGSLGCDIAV